MKTAIILILILAMFIGCAPSVSMDKYTELETAYGDLRAQYDLQKAQYDALQLNYGEKKQDYGVLEDKYNSLYNDWAKLSLENQVLQAGLKQLEMNYNNLLAFDKSVAQEKALSNLNAELEKMTQLYYEAVAKQEMKDWQSLAELQEFITEHKDEIVIQLLAGRDGAAQMDSQCVGKAMGLRELAKKYQRNIEVQQLSPLEYARIFQRNISTNHYYAVGLAIVAQADLYCIDTDYWDIKIAGYIP